jgi:maltose O-acetyltransferase
MNLQIKKISNLIKEEVIGYHPRLQFAQFICSLLPFYAGSRIRALALRAAGFNIGQGCTIWGMPIITGGHTLYKNLHIGNNAMINLGCLFDLGAPIQLGDNVALGHYVSILTTSHLQGPPDFRAGSIYALPVNIERGAWIGTHTTILPGVTIGSGAIVAAGALVTKNIPANSLAGGIPARIIKSQLPDNLSATN